MNSFLKLCISLLIVMLLGAVVIANYSIKENQLPKKKPAIQIDVIEDSPRNFTKKDRRGIQTRKDSVIYRDFVDGRSQKWLTRYKYVYIILEDDKLLKKASREFNRTKYLQQYPADAVDTKLIFSDYLPDPKVFDIIEKRLSPS